MSPEQALDKSARRSHRSLFLRRVPSSTKLATGVLPAKGDTSAAIFDGILHRDLARPNSLQQCKYPRRTRAHHQQSPPEKDRDLRYQHASDIRADLKRLKRETSGRTMVQPAAIDDEEPVASKKSSGQRKPASAGKVPIADPPPRSSKTWMIVAAAIVLLLLAGAGYFWFSRTSSKLTSVDTIVLADFANSTGDAVFDDTLKQALPIQSSTSLRSSTSSPTTKFIRL